MIPLNLFLLLPLFFTAAYSQNGCTSNVHAACGFWANIGECKKNPVFMQRDCLSACDPNCIVSATSCQNEDSDEDCENWASVGECDKNPHYMLWKCQKSCHPACGGAEVHGDDAWDEYAKDHTFADPEAEAAAHSQYLEMKIYVEDYVVEHELKIKPETEEKLFNLVGSLILNFAPDFCPLIGGGEIEQLAGKGDDAFMEYMESRLFHHPELQAQLEQMYDDMKVFTIEYIHARRVDSLSDQAVDVIKDVVGGLVARFAPTFCPVVNKTPHTHGDTAWEKYTEGVVFSSPEEEEMIHQLYHDMKSYVVEFSQTHGFELDAKKTKTLSDLVGGLIVTFAPDFCPLVHGKK